MAIYHPEYRDAYFPGTEELGPNEIRMTALGTGMPNVRVSQAASCFLIELGNGDVFFFDMGSGSMMRFAALGISYARANKLFLTHLHVDHIGDFLGWYVGGWLERLADSGVEVWGPSGPTPELGTKWGIESLAGSMKWDIASRSNVLPQEGIELQTHEFDFAGLNEPVYERNGVTIRSFPAVHCIDGAVSYSLEWNGMKIVYGGDTGPNKFFMEYAKGADVAIHESFIPVKLLMEKWGFEYGQAVNVGTRIHTSPAAWASVMAEVKPKLAIAYHFYMDFETAPDVFSEIRGVYDGPLSMAKDLMVYNITPEGTKVRQVINTQDTWPHGEHSGKAGTIVGGGPPMSDWLRQAAVSFPGVDEYPDVPHFQGGE